MLQKIGLEAVLKDADFRNGIKNYMGSVSQAEGLTGKATKLIGGAFVTMGKVAVAGIGAVVGAIAGIGVTSIKAAISVESAFAGVIKTTDGLQDEFGNLTELGKELQIGFRDLSKETPIAVEELMAIGELGGQLGVAADDLLGFTESIAAMGVATNLTTEEAAAGFAQIANIMGTVEREGSSAFEKLGSSIVALGNNSATTERDILSFGQRIAGAGKIAGLTEADVFGIGAAFASVGVEAEAGGTAVQKVLLSMTEAVAAGGEDLEAFAEASGMAVDDFVTMFETDAAGAFTAFVENLGLQGDNAIGILGELGLEDQRLIRAFLSLAGAGDVLTNAITLSNDAWEENDALAKEAAQRYATTESQIQIMKNTIKDIGVTIGAALLPIFNDLLQAVKPVVEEIGRLIGIFLDVGFDKFFSTFEDGSSYIGSFLETLGMGEEQAQSLGAEINTFVKTAGKNIKTFFKVAGKIFKQIWKWFEKDGPGALDNIKNEFEKVWDYIQKIIEKFTDFWDKNGEKIIKIGKAVFDWFQSSGVKAISSAWNTITKIFDNAFDTILGILEIFINVFSGDWQAAWESVKNVAATIWDTIKTLFWGVIDFILNLFGTNLQEVKVIWSNIWENVKTIAKTIWDNIKSYLITKWYEIKDNATTIWNQLKDSIVTILNLARTALISKAAEIYLALREKWITIRDNASTLWTELKTAVVGIVIDVKDTVKSRVEDLRAALYTKWTTIKNNAIDIWNQLKNAVIDIVNKILSWINKVFDGVKSIIEFVKNLNPFNSSYAIDLVPTMADMFLNPDRALTSAPISTTNITTTNNISMSFSNPGTVDPFLIREIVTEVLNDQLAKGI